MKPKEMNIGVSRTFNLGNFESLRIEAGITVSLDEDDDHDVVRQRMLDEVRKSLAATYRANHQKKNGA